jgi:hypothetical protein
MYSNDAGLSTAIRDAVQGLPGVEQLELSSTYDPRYGGKVLLGPADIDTLSRVEEALGLQREELGITDMEFESDDSGTGELYLAVVVALYRPRPAEEQRSRGK